VPASVPVPPRRAPLATVVLPAIEPSTSSRPPVMLVPPV